MRECEIDDFLHSVGGGAPAPLSLDEAIYVAMSAVDFHQPTLTFFGAIGDGVFYANPDESRFFPNSEPAEVVGSLRAEYGDRAVDAIAERI